jgi:hypothetical protein
MCPTAGVVNYALGGTLGTRDENVGFRESDRPLVGNAGIKVGLNSLAVSRRHVLHALSLGGGSGHNLGSFFFCLAQEAVKTGVERRGGGFGCVLGIVAKFGDRVFKVAHALGLLIEESLGRHEFTTQLGNNPINGISVVSTNGARKLFGIVRHVSPLFAACLAGMSSYRGKLNARSLLPAESGILEGILVGLRP